MKKLLSLLLCTVLVLSLFIGCGNGSTGETTGNTINTFSVGFAKANVSPQESMPLGGYNNSLERWSTSVEYPFDVICVAFSDEDGNTVLYITLDLLLSFNNFAKPLRTAVSEATGVPYERVMLHCDHNHSGPDMLLQDQPSISNFTTQVTNGAVEVAKAAMADRKPAQMYITYCRPQGHNFVRHYLLADGTFQAEGVGAVAKDQLIGHATFADNLLQLVKFTREGGKDVVMVNWQGHPPGTGEDQTIATSNYYGVLRAYLNEHLDCHSVFVLGGSGNVNNNSQIPGEVQHDGYIELGNALGAAAVEAAANFTQVNTGKILFKENILTVVNSSGENSSVPLYALAIGDFAMVMSPFEIFDTNAVAVREASGFKMTFYSSCSNKSNGYLPTPMSFDWEIAYEVRITKYPKGTAELIEQELTVMLDELFKQSGNPVSEKPADYLYSIPEPATNGVVYTVPGAGNTSLYRSVDNGFFALTVIANGTQIKNILVREESLAKDILSRETVQLIFDYQGVVVGIVE